MRSLLWSDGPRLFASLFGGDDNGLYVAHGVVAGAPDGHKACILCEAAQGVRCARAGRRSGSLGHPGLFPIMSVYRKLERGNDSGSDTM
jgi:hypothetical protein